MTKEKQLRLEEYLDMRPSVTSVGISLSMYMGLRIGEVCALQWRDIDLEKRTLTVSKTIQRVQCRTGSKYTKLIITEPKIESSKRTIPIPDRLLSMLRQFKDNGEVYVVSGRKKPVEPRTMQYRFAKILHNADLPSFHSGNYPFWDLIFLSLRIERLRDRVNRHAELVQFLRNIQIVTQITAKTVIPYLRQRPHLKQRL